MSGNIKLDKNTVAVGNFTTRNSITNIAYVFLHKNLN